MRTQTSSANPTSVAAVSQRGTPARAAASRSRRLLGVVAVCSRITPRRQDDAVALFAACRRSRTCSSDPVRLGFGIPSRIHQGSRSTPGRSTVPTVSERYPTRLQANTPLVVRSEPPGFAGDFASRLRGPIAGLSGRVSRIDFVVITGRNLADRRQQALVPRLHPFKSRSLRQTGAVLTAPG